MSKPIQAIDVSNMVPKAAPTAAEAVSGEDKAVSFSKVLSENEAAPAENDSLQIAPEGGKKLPPRKTPDAEQQQEKVTITTRSPIVPRGPLEIQVDTESGVPLPVETSDEAEVQEVLVQLTGEGKDLQVRGGSFVEPPTIQHAVMQAVNLPAVEIRHQPVSQLPTAGPQQPHQVLESLHVFQSGPAGAVSGKGPLLPSDGLPGPVLVDNRAAAVRIPPAEIQTGAPVAEATASTVRDAAQLAVASQGTNDALKQSLSEGRNFQPGMKVLAAQNQTDMSSAVFTQALADTSPALPSSKVQIPVGQPGWGRAVGQQVVWFVSQNISAANLRLNPQQLGPLEMHVSMEGDKASVAFVSQHAVVREALETTLPRLREMLAENGLNLANVNVSQQGSSDRRDQAASGSAHTEDAENSATGSANVDMAQGLPREVKTILGLVDFYV